MSKHLLTDDCRLKSRSCSTYRHYRQAPILGGATNLKTLISIIGPNGVGKSTTCQRLFQRLPNSCRIESEWCRSTNPFIFTPEVELLVEKNMSMLIRNYLQCSLVNYVILSYGFHGPRRRIYDNVLHNLSDLEFRLLPIILICSEEENVRRMLQDGREHERIERALEQSRPVYEGLPNPVIDTTHLSVDEAVDRILEIIDTEQGNKETHPFSK